MRKDYNLEKRKYVIGGFIVAIVCIFLVRLSICRSLIQSIKRMRIQMLF